LKENLTTLDILPSLTPEVMSDIEDIMQSKPVLAQF
jgi:hypothetical protein